MDQWRKIDGEPYEVSSDGCVRRIGGSVLKPRPHANGYQRVSLGAGKDAYIHRLVCRAFHGERTKQRLPCRSYKWSEIRQQSV